MAKKRKAAKATKAKARPAARKTAVKKAVKKPAKKASKRGSGLNKMSYSVSPALEAVVGGKKMSRPEIVKKLWAYIKSHKCQDTKNRRMIVPDAKLAEVFGGRKPIDMFKLMGVLNKHIKA